MAQVGIKGAYEGALQFVGNPALISRTHFARFLVETGVCKDTSEVFRRFLTEGKPGYVPHRWASLGDAVRWIHFLMRLEPIDKRPQRGMGSDLEHRDMNNGGGCTPLGAAAKARRLKARAG